MVDKFVPVFSIFARDRAEFYSVLIVQEQIGVGIFIKQMAKLIVEIMGARAEKTKEGKTFGIIDRSCAQSRLGQGMTNTKRATLDCYGNGEINEFSNCSARRASTNFGRCGLLYSEMQLFPFVARINEV